MSDKKIIIPFDFPFAILENRYNPDPTTKEIYALADGQYNFGPLSLFEYNKHEEYKKIGYENVQAPESPLKCKEYYIVHSPSTDTIEINDHGRVIYIKEMSSGVDEEQKAKQSVVDDGKSTTPTNKYRMSTLFHKLDECSNDLKDLKSLVLSEQRMKRRSLSTDEKSYNVGAHTVSGIRRQQRANLGHLSDDNSSSSTPMRFQRQPRPQAQTTVIKRTLNYPSSTEKKTKIPRVTSASRGTTATTPSSVLSSIASAATTHLTSIKKLQPILSSGYGQQTKKTPAPWAAFSRTKK